MSDEEIIFKDSVLLVDPLVPMWGLSSKDDESFGKTELIGYYGVFDVHKIIGKYIVYASATKCKISTKKIDLFDSKMSFLNKAVEEDLYSGDIQIYKRNMIEGPNFTGFFPLIKGNIWRSTNDLNADLTKIIFNDQFDQERVEEIIKGIEYQKSVDYFKHYDIYDKSKINLSEFK